jgi:hypothetical protein
VRQGFGDGDDPMADRLLQDALNQTKAPKFDKWTKDDGEAHGCQWHTMIMQQWHQGVQEKQISRAEAKFIRKEGSFPIFIKTHILPMWEQSKGVSFEAIQGLYEMFTELMRTKMRNLRGGTQDLYDPRRQLTQKEIENKTKATREARRTHQILKWTRLIEETLTWRTAELIGEEAEKELNGDITLVVKSHEKVREKKKNSLLKYMLALKSLISPLNADDEIPVDEDGEDDDEEDAGNVVHRSPQDELERLVKGSLKLPRKEQDLRTTEEKRIEETMKKDQTDEWAVQTMLNCELTRDQVETIRDAVWEDPREHGELKRTCVALRVGVVNKTLFGRKKDQDKFIKQADALRNRGEW